MQRPSLRRQLSDQGRELLGQLNNDDTNAKPDAAALADLEAQLTRLRGTGAAGRKARQAVMQKAKRIGEALLGSLKADLEPLLGTGPTNKAARQQLKGQIRDLEGRLQALRMPKFFVDILTLDGNVHAFSFGLNASIADVKNRIEKRVGIKKWKQELAVDAYAHILHDELKLRHIAEMIGTPGVRKLEISCIVDPRLPKPQDPDLFEFWTPDGTADTSCACLWRFALAGDVISLDKLLTEMKEVKGYDAEDIKAMINHCHHERDSNFRGLRVPMGSPLLDDRPEAEARARVIDWGGDHVSVLHATVMAGINWYEHAHDIELQAGQAGAGAAARAPGRKPKKTSSNQFMDVLQLLVEHGADPNTQNRLGSTALHAAVVAVTRNKLVDRKGIVNWLMEHDVCEIDGDCVPLRADVSLADHRGMTPLHTWAANFHIMMQVSNDQHVRYASFSFNELVRTCRDLIDAGGDAQRTAQTRNGRTPLALLLLNVPNQIQAGYQYNGNEWEALYARLDWLLRGRHANLAPPFDWYCLQWEDRGL